MPKYNTNHDMHFIQHGAIAKIKKGDQFLK